jgi:hypothetical protein
MPTIHQGQFLAAWNVDVVVLMFGIVVAITMGFFGFLSIWRIGIVPGAVADIVAFRRSMRNGQLNSMKARTRFLVVRIVG